MTNAYRIEGDFQMGRRRQGFRLECAAADEEQARDRIYTQLGSRHGVTRREIRIGTVQQIDADQLRSTIVRHQLEQ